MAMLFFLHIAQTMLKIIYGPLTELQWRYKVAKLASKTKDLKHRVFSCT